jgi:WASH complex subunit CCDC53
MSNVDSKPSKKNLNKKDLQDTRSIPFRQTLDLVSAFVISTTEMMNKFASNCEDKLNQVGEDLSRLENTLTILEAKLNSIQGLEQTQNTTQNLLPQTVTTSTNMNPSSMVEIPPV